ncbi:MAG: hypothetical protein J2P15_16685, partial [Micromonosporaceae bacterium]|nr:hypothetical protein [Micromonosporaceae bacterium]
MWRDLTQPRAPETDEPPWFEEPDERRTPRHRTVAPEAYFDDDRSWQTRPEVDPGWDIAPPDDPRWDDRRPDDLRPDDLPPDDPRWAGPRGEHRRPLTEDEDWVDQPPEEDDEQAEPRHAAVDTNLEAAWQNYLAEQEVPGAPDEGGRRLV